MHELTKLIKDDMRPALGVTEPGAIAYAVAKAKEYVSGNLNNITVTLNSGMYKNAFTCGIPHSNDYGTYYAVALGYVAGDAKLKLEALSNVNENDNELSKKLIADGKVKVNLKDISSKIYIEATITTDTDRATVIIEDSHTNITKIIVNDKVIFENNDSKVSSDNQYKKEERIPETIKTIHKYKLKDFLDYINQVDINEIEFVKDAYKVNLELFDEALKSDRTMFAHELLKNNGDVVISNNENNTASLLCNAAIEARVIGLDKAAMSITGSGAHGIIATMPLYAVYKINSLSEEKLYRATMLSYLVCTYIKEYSGKLSAFCGCAIAAGTGMACGLVYLKGGTLDMMEWTINNMASSITGMICDGGNAGCTMKGIVAVDAAFRSMELAMKGVHIDRIHGINGSTAEETMKNMGLIAVPGMVGTEKTIIDIFEQKKH